jgi:hypothetical protein
VRRPGAGRRRVRPRTVRIRKKATRGHRARRITDHHTRSRLWCQRLAAGGDVRAVHHRSQLSRRDVGGVFPVAWCPRDHQRRRWRCRRETRVEAHSCYGGTGEPSRANPNGSSSCAGARAGLARRPATACAGHVPSHSDSREAFAYQRRAAERSRSAWRCSCRSSQPCGTAKRRT